MADDFCAVIERENNVSTVTNDQHMHVKQECKGKASEEQ